MSKTITLKQNEKNPIVPLPSSDKPKIYYTFKEAKIDNTETNFEVDLTTTNNNNLKDNNTISENKQYLSTKINNIFSTKKPDQIINIYYTHNTGNSFIRGGDIVNEYNYEIQNSGFDYNDILKKKNTIRLKIGDNKKASIEILGIDDTLINSEMYDIIENQKEERETGSKGSFRFYTSYSYILVLIGTERKPIIGTASIINGGKKRSSKKTQKKSTFNKRKTIKKSKKSKMTKRK